MGEKILEVLKPVFESENVDKSCARVNCEKWDFLKHLELVVEVGSVFNVELEPEETAEVESSKDIKRISQGEQTEVVRFVSSVFESNAYLIKGDCQSQCYLIDCGDPEPILEELQCFNLKLAAIFITYSHFDHIYGLDEVVSNIPFIKVYPSLRRKEGLFSDRLNMSRYHSTSFIYEYGDNTEVVENNCIISLFGRDEMQMKTYETPGHNWGVCCFQIDNCLFTGDFYLPQHRMVTTFPRSDKRKTEKSLERIRRTAVGYNLYPGYGEIIYV